MSKKWSVIIQNKYEKVPYNHLCLALNKIAEYTNSIITNIL